MRPKAPSPLCLAGATATGKSALAQALAERTGGAILSADAMLVYRGLDIGTAKPTSAERGSVPYFGLDCVAPDEPFSTAAWLALANAARAHCAAAAQPLYVVGGTGLYFSAFLRGLDPAPPIDPALRAELEALPLAALQTRLARFGAKLGADAAQNPRRLVRALELLERGFPLPGAWREGPKPPLVALTWERALLHRRIAERVQTMFRAGLIEEAEGLRARYPAWSRTACQAIGYAEVFAYLEGRLTLREAQERIVVRTRQLARRQETYLRHQFAVRWVLVAPGVGEEALIARVLAEAGR